MPPVLEPRRPLRLGCDGHARTAAEERELDVTLAAVFAGAAGQKALAYLRSITIEAVCGPAVSDAELRHREGMRSLVGIIETRIQKGRNHDG
jgi:hypothetical protein